MKNSLGYRIRKLRESKDYSQENMAGELGISTSAYSKIERDITDVSVGRVTAIAKILEVDIKYFFTEHPVQVNQGIAHDDKNPYGNATKSDIDELTSIINKMKQEIAKLQASIKTAPAAAGKKKKA